MAAAKKPAYSAKATNAFAANVASAPYLYPQIRNIRDECEMTGASRQEARELIIHRLWFALSDNYSSMFNDYPLLEGVVPGLDECGIDLGKVADKFLEGYGPRPSASKNLRRKPSKPAARPKQSGPGIKRKQGAAGSTGKAGSANTKGSHLMDIRELGTRTWYRAQNPATLARRLYGRHVHVREEHQTAFQPTYRIWTAVDDRGVVYGRLYTDEVSWRGEDEYDDDY